MNERSGWYQLQPTGYKAFILQDLPPQPPVEIGEDIRKLLISAEQRLAELNGIGFSLPNPDLFIAMAIRKEALLSSQIEGTQATMTDVLTYETWEEVDNLDDVQDVVNYIKSLRHGIARLEELPLCLRIIKECHNILLNSVRRYEKTPGEFRKSQNWIGPSLKNATFVPPPHERVPEAMGNLEKFVNQENSHPFLIKCALIHYQFETIHPFLDGNGRIGRLLIDLFIHWKGLLNKPLIYTSLFFKQNRQEYFDRLMLTRKKGDFEQWIEFFLKAMVWSAEHAVEKIKQILLLQENLRQKIMREKKASLRSIQLLDILFISPLTNITNIAKKLDISFQAASEQAKLFLRLGILEELTGQKRSRKFAFAPYLKIVEE
ncbi:MAG: Adenosine monophosphate-protein transferase SoFic [Chlamydiae bacterium]|nr:Adenosine monophosphate-protein transferase SoFic [Chlamydiota bacterium]